MRCAADPDPRVGLQWWFVVGPDVDAAGAAAPRADASSVGPEMARRDDVAMTAVGSWTKRRGLRAAWANWADPAIICSRGARARPPRCWLPTGLPVVTVDEGPRDRLRAVAGLTFHEAARRDPEGAWLRDTAAPPGGESFADAGGARVDGTARPSSPSTPADRRPGHPRHADQIDDPCGDAAWPRTVARPAPGLGIGITGGVPSSTTAIGGPTGQRLPTRAKLPARIVV